MIAGERVGLPHGWAIETRADPGPPIYVATYVHRLVGDHELRFESTSWSDLLDQVHEALDAWQTELEISQGGRARAVVRRGEGCLMSAPAGKASRAAA